MAETDKVFQQEKSMVSSSFDKPKGESHLAQANTLKAAAHKVILRLEKLSGKKGAAIINKAGRLRALSQRINLLYLLKTMEIESTPLTEEMIKAMTILKESLELLTEKGVFCRADRQRAEKAEKDSTFLSDNVAV